MYQEIRNWCTQYQLLLAVKYLGTNSRLKLSGSLDHKHLSLQLTDIWYHFQLVTENNDTNQIPSKSIFIKNTSEGDSSFIKININACIGKASPLL